jgi:DNA-binding NtrC family response regulator
LQGFRNMAIVLMVEDEEQIRVLAESVLQEAGHKVITATGIEGARALLDSDQRIDVLFLDLNLGGDPEAGLLVAQQAQAMRPKLSYLYTTGAGVNEGMKGPVAAACRSGSVPRSKPVKTGKNS